MPTMKAVQVSKAGAPFELVDRDIPEPGPGQIRIKVEACGVCHSDAMVKAGAFPGLQLPRVPGHEGHCFRCTACRKGWFINCEQAKITGISHDGGFAEYMVSPVEAVARLPDKLTALEAAPLLCAGVTTYNSLRNSGARAGDTVAVQGIGGLGHLALQYSANMGFRTVAISRGADKEDLARHLGAHEYLDTEKISAAEGLKKLGGADLVLATAPHSEAITSTIDGLKPRGKLLLVAAPFEPLTVSAFALLSGRTIAGWPSGSSIDSEETMSFSALTGVRPRTETFKLDQADAALAKVMDNRIRFRAVLIP